MKLLTVTGLLLICVVTAAQRNPNPFLDGDRVVFAGNSITEAGFYENYVWLYYITHFPDRKIKVLNGGIGGDVAEQIYTRLKPDILAMDPTVVVVTFGMNDSRYFEYINPAFKGDSLRDAAIAASLAGFEKIVAVLDSFPKIRKIIMSSSPYDETMKNEKNYFPGKSKTMEGIIRFQRRIAEKNDWAYIDLFCPMTAIQQREQRVDSTFTLTGPDRIHPGKAGHLVMAYLFLKSQKLDNIPVCAVEIDVAALKVKKSINCTISGLSSSGNAVSFSYLSNSLPFPVDTRRDSGDAQGEWEALKVIPFQREFNQELFVLKGLKPGKYAVFVDGKHVAEFSNEELNNGINLALSDQTPQNLQAQKVRELLFKRKAIEDKIRSYYWVNFNYLRGKGMLFNDGEAALDSVVNAAKRDFFVAMKKDDYEEVRLKSTRDSLQQQMQLLEDKMYETARPVMHEISIREINN